MLVLTGVVVAQGIKKECRPAKGRHSWLACKEASVFLAALAAATAEAFVGQAGEGGTHERGHDEEPQLAAGTPAVSVAEEGLAQRASGVDAGVGQRDAHEVDEHQGETDGQAAELAVGVAVVGDAEDDHQEDEGQQGLDQEGAAHADAQIVGIAGGGGELSAVAVGGEDTRLAHAGGIPDAEQHSTGDDGADALAHPVEEHVLQRHTAIDPHAERDGGVQVGTADVPHTVSHGNDSEAEGNGHTEETNMSEQRGTAAAQNQHECTQTFGKHLVANLHNVIVLEVKHFVRLT